MKTLLSHRIVAALAAVGLFLAFCPPARGGDWPQWRGPSRDGVWNETGIVETLPAPQVPLKWRAPIAGGYSGPTVAEGRVYVTDRVLEPEESERVLCFDAANGEPLWSFVYPCVYSGVGYPDGPRAAVTIADGLAYAVGTMGHLHCLDAATGAVVWRKQPGTDYDVAPPTWGVAAAPLVEGDLLIAQLGARPDACVVAWDRKTGDERWRALSDAASYAAPIVIDQAARRVLVCWTGDSLAGLDCATGALLWRHATPPSQMIINITTPVLYDGHLFVSSFYDGAHLFRLAADRPAIDLLWHRAGPNERNTDALHSLLATPLLMGGHIYGVDTHGELRCLEMATGDRIWEDTTAVAPNRWANIHMVRNAERIWMFNEQGELLIARLTPAGFEEISRARLISPTKGQLGRGDGVCWSHPAYANRHVFARNDEELVCASLAAE